MVDDILPDEMKENLTPQFIAGLIWEWEQESNYNFDVDIQSPNDMEIRASQYNDAINNDKEITEDEMFKDSEYNGEFIIRKTMPQNQVIVYFHGDSNHNRYAILEEVGIHIDNLIKNRVIYDKTLKVKSNNEKETIQFTLG